MGTVGAVAVDASGNLAAATSLRVASQTSALGEFGDSPLIGAGCYANGTAAVSCTAQEKCSCVCLAYDICALMEYRSLHLFEACNLVVMEKLCYWWARWSYRRGQAGKRQYAVQYRRYVSRRSSCARGLARSPSIADRWVAWSLVMQFEHKAQGIVGLLFHLFIECRLLHLSLERL